MANNLFTVDVQVQYLPQQSYPQQGVYRFSYTITITNVGDCLAQVVARRWLITDERRHMRDVRGLGIAGRQPALEPGASHTYTSGCELSTPQGQMQGHYICITEEGEVFECPIAPFALDADALPDLLPPTSPPNRGQHTLH